MGKPLSRKNMNRTAGWRYSSGTLHAAFDYGVDLHTPVFAVRPGKILKVVDNIPNLDKDVDGQPNTPANFILQGIKFKGDKATVIYAHLSPHVLVNQGDQVDEGQQIALSGHNGHSEGPHLHISAVTGHATHNFPELDGLASAAMQPTTGLASNGSTIFPPSRVFGREKFNELDAGDIVLEELTFRTKDSDTVRRLQQRLNGIHLEGGAELRVSGDYTKMTRDEVIKWQVQKRKAEPGSAEANGDVNPEQAAILFKAPRFRIIP
jgi:hypothetical protein